MKLLKNKYLWLSLIFLVAGFICENYVSEFDFETESVTILKNGTPENFDIIKIPSYCKYLNILSNLFYTIAISIIISVFVIQAIEEKRKNEHEEELNELRNSININVFDSLFKTIIPAEVYDVIKSDIISNKIIRRDANWIYDFYSETDGITLKQTMKYKMYNMSNILIEEPLVATLDTTETDEELLSASCVIDGKKVIVYDKNSKNDGNVQIFKDSDGLRNVKINFSIPPKKYADITLIWLQKFKQDQIKDGYFTKYPIINAELCVNFPVGYNFWIFQCMSNEMINTLSESNRKMYKLEGAILSYQGFVFHLDKCT